MHHHLRNLNKQKLFIISDLLIKSLFLRYRRPALVDDPNAGENQYHRYTLLPGEVVQTDDDADDGGDDGLHIIIHADQRLTSVGRKRFCPMGMRKYATKVAKNTTKAICHATRLSICPKGMCIRLLMLKGTVTSMVNRNIHFMKVTTLYFEMSGRKMPR